MTHAATAQPLQTLTLGGGCFWCLDAVYRRVRGVVAVESVVEARSFEIVADPRLELGDVIGAVTEAGEHVVGRVVAVSVVLDDPGSRMRVDVEALLW